MEEAKVSPRPWRRDKADESVLQTTSKDAVVAFHYGKNADIEHIVRVVNAHDALLAACRDALALLDKQREEYAAALTIMPRPRGQEVVRGPVAEALAAALALALPPDAKGTK